MRGNEMSIENNENQSTENPETQPPKPPAGMSNPYLMSKDQFGDMVYTMSKDMKFLGIISIIYGILNCLTIFGALVGVPFIFAGIRLKESGDSFGFYSTNYDEMALQQAIERQKRFYFIMKVLVIITIVISLLAIILYVLFLGFLFSNFEGLDEIFREFQ